MTCWILYSVQVPCNLRRFFVKGAWESRVWVGVLGWSRHATWRAGALSSDADNTKALMCARLPPAFCANLSAGTWTNRRQHWPTDTGLCPRRRRAMTAAADAYWTAGIQRERRPKRRHHVGPDGRAPFGFVITAFPWMSITVSAIVDAVDLCKRWI